MPLLTARANISLKSGRTILQGEKCTVRWEDNQATVMIVQPASFDEPVRLRTTNAPRYFEEVEAISMEELEEAVHDCTCPSILGDSVEPDGWDSQGSPSWLMAMGMI